MVSVEEIVKELTLIDLKALTMHLLAVSLVNIAPF